MGQRKRGQDLRLHRVMEGQDAQGSQQERQQVITGKLRRGDEGALREDRHTEDPPFQVQGVGTYRGAREEEQLRQEGEERLTSSLPHKPKKRSAPLCWPLLKL